MLSLTYLSSRVNKGLIIVLFSVVVFRSLYRRADTAGSLDSVFLGVVDSKLPLSSCFFLLNISETKYFQIIITLNIFYHLISVSSDDYCVFLAKTIRYSHPS